MSIPRVECRTKVSVETDRVIDAKAEARGVDKAEVVRQVLERWAAEELHAAKLLGPVALREGTAGINRA